jgi:prepilin-type processing-associated H-X9-DG protein
MKDLLRDRERGEEAEHFRREDAKLIEKMRERARLTEIAQALASKLRIDEAELLRRVVELGLDQDTGTAILLAPLVQVAWADGHVTDAERRAIVDLAASRGLVDGMPAHDKLLEWLRQRPSDALFEAALEVMRVGFAMLPADERDQRIRDLVAACRRVAEASGTTLARMLGIHDGVTHDESVVLDEIGRKLRASRPV